MARRSLAVLTKPQAVRTAAVSVGLLAAAGALAPAAWAADDSTGTDPAAPTTTPAETTADETPPVLTTAPETTAAATSSTTDSSAPASTSTGSPAPVAATVAVPNGAHFGTGKFDVSLGSSAGTLPAGVPIVPTGAQVRLTFSVLDDQPSTASTLCTFDSTGDCVFDADGVLQRTTSPIPNLPMLPANSDFTLTLVTAPSSGQLLLPSPLVAVPGWTDTTPSSAPFGDTIPVAAPDIYRTVGVSLTGDAPLAGATFALCTVAGAPCADPADEVTGTTGANGQLVFPGRYAAGSYAIRQTGAPGGRSFDASVATLTVSAAQTAAQSTDPVRLTVQGPVTPVSGPAPTPSAPAPSTAGPVVEDPSITRGQEQTISLSGFTPGELVHGVLHSTPVDLGTVTADALGVATFTFRIPAGLEIGTHSVSMTGLTSGNTASVGFAVTGTGTGTSGSLAYTGADVLPLIGLGAVLVAAGGATITVARRRRTA